MTVRAVLVGAAAGVTVATIRRRRQRRRLRNAALRLHQLHHAAPRLVPYDAEAAAQAMYASVGWS